MVTVAHAARRPWLSCSIVWPWLSLVRFSSMHFCGCEYGSRDIFCFSMALVVLLLLLSSFLFSTGMCVWIPWWVDDDSGWDDGGLDSRDGDKW